jgi:hypothetical protein
MDNIYVWATYFFGALLVAAYAWLSFDAPEYYFEEQIEDNKNYGALAKPGLPRYMTERFRYRTYNLVFVLFALAEYFLLAILLPVIPGIETLFQLKGANPELGGAAMALASALLLIGAVQFVEWPRKLLFDFVKGWLHDFADIPEMGRSLFEALCYEQVDYESNVGKAHIGNILMKNAPEPGAPRQDLLESDFKGGNAKSIIWKWARLSYGIEVVEKWRDDNPIFATQLSESSLGWLRLYNVYTDTIDDVIRFRSGKLDEDQKVILNHNIEELLANCHRLMACLVIMVTKTGEDPFLYIKDEGYRVIPGNRFSVKKGEIARVIVAIVPPIVLIALTSLFGGIFTPLDELVIHIMIDVVSGLIILAVPIFVVITAKRLLALKGVWRAVTQKTPYDSFFEMPLGIYSILSIASFALSTILMMTIINTDQLLSFQSWQTMSVFCFISAITAFFAAYRTDIPPRLYLTRLAYYFNRAKGALLQGTLTAANVWLGCILIDANITNIKVFEFTMMGFAAAIVVNLTLFTGKHHFEKRHSPRIVKKQAVSAVVDGITVPASLMNRSEGGASLKVNKNHTAPKGAEIELIVDNHDHLFGLIKRTRGGEMHISFRQQSTGDPTLVS